MAHPGAAASTLAEAAHAATQPLIGEAAEGPGTAVDGLVAGVLAIAALHPAVLLGGCTILLGGMGEGERVIDGRALQPGRDAPRPRGFVEPGSIPTAARIGVPGLPAALALAHAGRGGRTLTALARVALASASAHGRVDGARADSILAFGRDGAGIVQRGSIRDALLAAAARSLGGVLVGADLDALRPTVETARVVTVGVRSWCVPSSVVLDGAARVLDDAPPIEIVAVLDAHGAFAIAAVALASESAPLDDVGLAAPLLARPVLRGVARTAPGAPLPLASPIGLARLRERGRTDFGGVDLGLGVAGAGEAESGFADLVRHVSAPGATLDDAFARPRATSGAGCGVSFDGGRSMRSLKDLRR